MSALTLRLPSDKHARLKSLARRRGTSVNRLMEEMATVMITEADAEAVNPAAFVAEQVIVVPAVSLFSTTGSHPVE